MAPAHIENRREPSSISPNSIRAGSSTRPTHLNAPEFHDRFDAILWRPKSSGRDKSKVWIERMLRPAVNLRGATPEARREAFREQLVNEDVTHPSHPNMRAPKDCVNSPYAYRLWPDKVQALVALDQVLPGSHVPNIVRLRKYEPVGLHQPRLTVTRVTSNPIGTFDLSFAETDAMLRVATLNDVALKFSRARDRNAVKLRKQGIAKLHTMYDLFSDEAMAKSLAPYIETLQMPLRPELADALPNGTTPDHRRCSVETCVGPREKLP